MPSSNLQNASYLENIVKIAEIDFNKSKFFETKIDSNNGSIMNNIHIYNILYCVNMLFVLWPDCH
jgi:hypothetical protein